MPYVRYSMHHGCVTPVFIFLSIFIRYGSPKFLMKKCDSDKAINKSSSASSKGRKNGGGAANRQKFKRSLTMSSIPAEVLNEAQLLNESQSRCLSPRVLAMRRQDTNRFTIGTSDESDDDTNDEDLQKLFCPLTDSNGSPFLPSSAADVDNENEEIDEGSQLSASSCRKVHSEILASVSRIKCSLLGRKGGLLQTYSNGGNAATVEDSSDGENSRYDRYPVWCT